MDLLYRILNVLLGILIGYFVLMPYIFIISLGLTLHGVRISEKFQNLSRQFDLEFLWDLERIKKYILTDDLGD